MKKTITIISAVMAVIMLTAFTDVKKTHWAYSNIEQAYSKGLVSGLDSEAKYFEPDSTATKEEIALMIYKTLCSLSPEIKSLDYSSECGVFLQNSGISEWANKGLSYGFKMGYWTEDDFKSEPGSAEASRKYIAKWLAKIAPHKNYALRTFTYSDFDEIEKEFLSDVDIMSKYGLMNGAEGCFLPNSPMTRAEATTVIVRLYDAIKADKFKTSEEPAFYLLGQLKTEAGAGYFRIDDTIISLSDDAKMLIDGKNGKPEDIAKLNGKTVSISSFLDGDYTDTVIIQSYPLLQSGRIDGVEVRKNPSDSKKSYKVVTINVDGLELEYIADNETEIIGELALDSQVQFIADGIYLLEIE